MFKLPFSIKIKKSEKPTITCDNYNDFLKYVTVTVDISAKVIYSDTSFLANLMFSIILILKNMFINILVIYTAN